MAYLQSIRAQTVVFFWTVGFGFLLGAAYDILRFVRLLTDARRFAAWDVGFGAASGAAAFLFLLTQNGGKVRVYLLAAIALGFFAWYCGFGRQLRAATDSLLRGVRRAAERIRRPFTRLAARIGKGRERLCRHVKKAIKSRKKNRKPS